MNRQMDLFSSRTTVSAPVLNWLLLTNILLSVNAHSSVTKTPSRTSNLSVPGRDAPSLNHAFLPIKQRQPNWKRKRREVADRESPLDQDSRCNEFINSVLIPQSMSTANDPSGAIMPGFFNVPKLHKRGNEYRFQTPNYPDYFPHNLECIKIISAPTKEHRILLHFRGLFELEPEPHCLMDFLEVRDGAFGYSPLIGRYCSNRPPDVGKGLHTTGPFMWLRFRSDASIAHRGFQAVYRFFQTTPGLPPDNVYRFRYRMDLTPGEMWKLDQQFLLDNLRDFPPEMHHLAIEASFDVRAPNNTYLFLHVVNVTVPQEFAWSCAPDELLAQNARSLCRSINPLIFATKDSKKDYDGVDVVLDKVSIHDPASIIDGRRTIFEFYSHRSISPYVTPCPKVRRFCDRSIGKNRLENNRESDRDFFLRQSRMIIRIVIVSPIQTAATFGSNRRLRSSDELQPDNTEDLDNPVDRNKRQLVGLRLPQMPTFHFQVTALKKTRPEYPNAPCEENWTACDAETCIPKAYWCDKVFNCPQWQDEGPHCEELQNERDEAHKSPMELRKEQEKREADAEQLAAQTLHLSILGSLGLLLTLVTITCIVMTLRRRKKEQTRHQIKVKENSVQPGGSPLRPTPRLNHVMSTGVLLQDNNTGASLGRRTRATQKTNHLSKSSSIQDRERLFEVPGGFDDQKFSNQVNTGWNSTDSVDAPLLWQKKSIPTSSGGKTSTNHLLGKWNHTTPGNLVFKDSVHYGPTKDKEGKPKMDVESVLKASTTQVVHSPFRSRNRVTASLGQNHTVVSVMPAVSSEHKVPSVGDSPQRVSTTARQQVSAITHGSSSRRSDASGLGTPSHSRRVETAHKLNTASPSGSLWVSGPSTRQPTTPVELLETNRAEIQSKRSLVEQQPRTTVRAVHDFQRQPRRIMTQPPDQHLANCRLINRTQSWGGGLRLAGVEPICNGKWEATHSFDYAESPFESNLAQMNKSPKQERRMIRDVKQQGSEGFPVHLGWQRPKVPYVSMPDMNGAIARAASPHQRNTEVISSEPKSQGFTLSVRDFKPPSAKRPRMIDQPTEEQQWVPTGYVTDTDEELSAGTAIMDDFGSVLSGSAMPELQENQIRPYSSPGRKLDIGILTVKAAPIGTSESPRHLVPRLYIAADSSVNADPNNPTDLVADYQGSNSSSGPLSPGSTVPTSSMSNSEGEDPYRSSRASQHGYSTESDIQLQPHLEMDPLVARTSPNLFTMEQNSLSPRPSPVRESEAVFTVRTMIPDSKPWFTKGGAGSSQKSKSANDTFVYEYEA